MRWECGEYRTVSLIPHINISPTKNQIDYVLTRSLWNKSVLNVERTVQIVVMITRFWLLSSELLLGRQQYRSVMTKMLIQHNIVLQYKINARNCWNRRTLKPQLNYGHKLSKKLSKRRKHISRKKAAKVPWITANTLKLVEERRQMKLAGLNTDEQRDRYRKKNHAV